MRIPPDELALLDRGGRPTLADMLAKMTFSPTRGSIDLNGARMVLSRATFGADLQDELVRRYGERAAMVLLLRLGYRSGREDAEFVRRAWPNLDVGDAFTAGTRLHMVTGTVRVETLHNDFDFRNDRFSGDFLWHGSVEAMEYQRRHGRATKPVCWAQTGYAAGYASVFFRKLILYKEVSCAAMGDKSCRVVGKTVDGWGKDDPFVRMFLDEVLVTRAESPSRIGTESAAETAATAGGVEDLVLAPVRKELDLISKSGVNALITGPEGTGRFMAAQWLRTRRFEAAELHRVHGAAQALPDRIRAIRQSLAKGTASGQVLVIDTPEEMPDPVQIDLLELMHSEKARLETLLIVGISRKSPSRLRIDGDLRAELLFALSVGCVSMPPLSSRADRPGALADAFLARMAQRNGRPGMALSQPARDFVDRQPWHGNLPELEHAVMRAALLSETPAWISAEDLGRAIAGDTEPGSARHDAQLPPEADGIDDLWRQLRPMLHAGLKFDDVVAALERRALDETGGNTSAAARLLGLTRAKLDYRLRRKGPRD